MTSSSKILVLTSEQPYNPDNDVTLLGTHLKPNWLDVAIAPVNRYVLAGLERADGFVDEALWRARPDALERLLRAFAQQFDIYGYQFQGNVKRLPASWQHRLAFVERVSVPQVVGRMQGTRSLDRYLMCLAPEDFEVLPLSHGAEAWFRFFLLRREGERLSELEFSELNRAYASIGADWWQRYVDPRMMNAMLDWFEAAIWFTYSPGGRHSDGPHLGICTRHRWRRKFRRMFRARKHETNIFMDLTAGNHAPGYILDLI